VIKRYFDSSYVRVVSSLIEEEKLSVEELQKIIEQIKTQQKQ